MTIKAWKHPIKYLRLVTTPTCDKCRNCRGASMITTYNYRCASRRYLEHVNRLRGTNQRNRSRARCARHALVRLRAD